MSEVWPDSDDRAAGRIMGRPRPVLEVRSVTLTPEEVRSLTLSDEAAARFAAAARAVPCCHCAPASWAAHRPVVQVLAGLSALLCACAALVVALG